MAFYVYEASWHNTLRAIRLQLNCLLDKDDKDDKIITMADRYFPEKSNIMNWNA